MFRFTIRDVLWLTVVAALACGWGLDHWHMKAYFQFLAGEAESAQNLRVMCEEQERMILDLLRERRELVSQDESRFPRLDAASGNSNADSPATPASSAPSAVPTNDEAIQIVRSLALRPGHQAQFTCKDVPEGFRVFVEYFVLDEEGNRVFSPGGHALYLLDKSGKVQRVIRGI